MAFTVRKVVVPAAGLGTRGLPFTKEVPKELSPVLDVPALQLIVEEAIASGIEQIVLVTSRGKGALEDFLSPKPDLERWLEARGKTAYLEMVRKIGKQCECLIVRQNQPLGLGHAVEAARLVVGNEPFAVALGDEVFPRWNNDKEPPALKQLTDAATATNASVVGVMEVGQEETSSYGIVDLGGASPVGKPVPVRSAVEKPAPADAPSRYAIIGRYVFEPSIFEELARTEFGKNGEKQLTDAMRVLATQGHLGALAIRGRRYDLGSPVPFVLAQIDAALARPELAARLREELAKRTK